MEIKINDVYSFRYNAEETKKMFEPYHCFDGQLIVRESNKGGLILVDTYWSYDNRTFTLEEALSKGQLTFKFNIDDVQDLKLYDMDYYADEDIFDFSHQHGCYKRYVLRKGAEKSIEKQERVLLEKIDNCKRNIESEKRSLDNYVQKLVKLKQGETIFI